MTQFLEVKVKVKVTLEQATKAQTRSRGITILSLTSALDRDKATPRPLYPQERPGTHCIGGWVGPRAGLEGCGKIFAPWGIEPRTLQTMASRYVDWTGRKILLAFSSGLSQMLPDGNWSFIKVVQLQNCKRTHCECIYCLGVNVCHCVSLCVNVSLSDTWSVFKLLTILLLLFTRLYDVSTSSSAHWTLTVSSSGWWIDKRHTQISCVRQLIKPNIVYKDTTGMSNRMIGFPH